MRWLSTWARTDPTPKVAPSVRMTGDAEHDHARDAMYIVAADDGPDSATSPEGWGAPAKIPAGVSHTGNYRFAAGGTVNGVRVPGIPIH